VRSVGHTGSRAQLLHARDIALNPVEIDDDCWRTERMGDLGL
jgi:hypothetical protein